MKNKLFVIIVICIALIIIILLFYQTHGNKTFKFNANNINSVTVQYKTNTICIKEPKELNELLNNFINLEFAPYSSATGSKGWTYWIRCYSSDKLVYDFTIQNKDTIKYNKFFYKIKNGSIDISYFESLFNKLK